MRTLLIDTCGENASIALADGAAIVASAVLPARSSSPSLLPAIAAALQHAGWTRKDISGIGVVNGPGSFTGVRVGLSCAKGFCEALRIPMVAVSRLKVLAASAGLHDGYAVLSAGRDELFVLDMNAEQESLESIETFSGRASEKRIVICEEQLVGKFGEKHAELHALSAASSQSLVMERLLAGGDDSRLADANYVRSEQQIYGRASLTPGSRQ